MRSIKKLEEIKASLKQAILLTEIPTLKKDLDLLEIQIEKMKGSRTFVSSELKCLREKYKKEIFLNVNLLQGTTLATQALERIINFINNEDIYKEDKILIIQILKLMCHFELQVITIKLQAKNVLNQFKSDQSEKIENLLELAEKMATIVKEESIKLGIDTIFSVIDGGGNLVLFHRMDKALLASIEISMNKAYTALFFQRPSHELAPLVQTGGMLDGLLQVNPKIIPFGGGFLMKSDNKIIGAIGISGGTVEEDIKVARRVLDYFELA